MCTHLGFALAAEFKDCLGNFRTAGDLQVDLIDGVHQLGKGFRVLQLARFFQLREQGIDQGLLVLDNLQRVIDFMGKTGRHLPEFRQPAGADELLAQIFFLCIEFFHPADNPVGHVKGDGDDGRHRPGAE